MSMRKKRTLAGVFVNNSNSEKVNKIILPATSMSLSVQKKNYSEAVRGTEFLVDPNDCRLWKFHNRDNVWMNVDKCQDLILSIRKNGQKVPIFARKLDNDPDGKNWEIIAGCRRWFACNYLGKKIRVKATDASDRECAILMNLENKDRNDISEFEDAVSYRQQLEAKLFDSQDEMAMALDLKKSKLSKMLSAAKIIEFQEIMSLFKDVTKLKINPIYSLVLLIEKNDNNKEVVLRRAKELNTFLLNKKTETKPAVIVNELIKSVEKKADSKEIFVKSYNIGEKTVLKATQPTSRKIIFELINYNSKKQLDMINKFIAEALSDLV